MIVRSITLFIALVVQNVAASTCDLHAEAGKQVGSCGALVEDEPTTLSIAPATAITSGTWQQGESPLALWSGSIVVGQYPATPVEIEVFSSGSGAMRTAFGWFPVAHFASTPGDLHFDVDAGREVPPSAVDRQIVQRAAQILSSVAAWNRSDTRDCPATATTWSIYCAMMKATSEAAGAFHHRRPALQVVRAIVDERTAGRPYEHRLMDYNNDPTTRLADVQSLFAEALKRIDAAQVP